MSNAELQGQSEATVTTTTEFSLLDQILGETKLTPHDDGYDVARRGVAAFIGELMKPSRQDEKVNNAVIDQMLAELDRKLSLQLDEILHSEPVQALESAWRGLKFTIDRTDFRQNIKIELLSVTKDELLTDFEDSPEIVKSGLYRHIYTAEFGQFGGQPVAAMVASYEFGPGNQDIKL